jgi:hypothetical protein
MENMVKKPMRVVIYPKDIEIITGRKTGAARNLYWSIMRTFDKKPGQFITFQEFSVFTGIDEETVLEYLMDS